jgi:hypothetical protein
MNFSEISEVICRKNSFCALKTKKKKTDLFIHNSNSYLEKEKKPEQ